MNWPFITIVDEDLCTELEARRFGPWRPFDVRGAALHEWHPPPPTRPTLRSTVSFTNSHGIDLDLVHRIWALHAQAAHQLGAQLDNCLETEGLSLVRTGCRLDTHRDHPGGILSMSLALTDPDDYDGGELYIYRDDGDLIIAKPPRRTVLVWPSHLRHGVNRVTRGQRLTYVSKAVRSSWPEVDRLDVLTGRTRAGHHDQREISRRLRLQAAHNRAAAAAHEQGDPDAMRQAIDDLWASR